MKKLLSFLIIIVFCFQVFAFGDSAKADEQKNLKQGRAMILVNFDNEKSLYDELVLQEQNFDFKIDIVSLKEKGVSRTDARKIKEFLWSQKEEYNYFVLDEEIVYGVLNETFYSDYFYAHSDDFFEYSKDGAKFFGGTVERYPTLILSRIKRSQIGLYLNKKKLDNLSGMFALPTVFFNRHQTECGVGNYQIDLSYSAYFLKRKFELIKPQIKITTLCDDKSSNLLPKDRLKIKPRMKPDMTLSKENFEKLESENNLFLLFSTGEPQYEENIPLIWPHALTSALWQDKNKDGAAEESEIESLTIKKYSEMNKDNIFSMHFIPVPHRFDMVATPFLICQLFYFQEDVRNTTVGYFVDDDHEACSVSTVWNAILSEIMQGTGFAEANLLGYTKYFKLNKDEEDLEAQGVSALRLFFLGLPWYNIDDLVSQPEIQIEKDKFQIMGKYFELPIKNVGDQDLVVTFNSSRKDIKVPNEIIVKPNESKILTIEKVFNTYFPNRLPVKYNTSIELQTNDRKHPKVTIFLEFWE
jgi:hypothetical protein